MRRRWLNYEAHEEAYLEDSAFIHYAARLRFHYSLVQSKVIDLETLASIGHYYFIRIVFFFVAISQTRPKQDLHNRNSNKQDATYVQH